MQRFISGQRAEKVTGAYIGHLYHSLQGLGRIMKGDGRMGRDTVEWCLWVTASMKSQQLQLL